MYFYVIALLNPKLNKEKPNHQENYNFVNNDNITRRHLYDKSHLNDDGLKVLAKNYANTLDLVFHKLSQSG